MSPEGQGGSTRRSNVLHHRIPFGETDAAGVVYYPNYLRWYDRATHELFRALGLTMKELHDRWSVVLPVVSVQASFKASLHYDEEVEIRSQITELSERTLKVSHVVTRDGTEVSSGLEVRGWVSVAGGAFKTQAIPEELRKRLM